MGKCNFSLLFMNISHIAFIVNRLYGMVVRYLVRDSNVGLKCVLLIGNKQNRKVPTAQLQEKARKLRECLLTCYLGCFKYILL